MRTLIICRSTILQFISQTPQRGHLGSRFFSNMKEKEEFCTEVTIPEEIWRNNPIAHEKQFQMIPEGVDDLINRITTLEDPHKLLEKEIEDFQIQPADHKK